MNVKIKVPTSLNDITVKQFQDISIISENDNFDGYRLDSEILKIVLRIDNVDNISKKDRNILLKDIENALLNKGEFQNRFTLNGIEYGLIPNFDNITNGEYIDLIKYSQSIETLHNFLAVAYRPIKDKDRFGNYSIVDYNGTSEHYNNMLELPMSISKGVEGFFLTIYNDLKTFITMSTAQEVVRGI